LSYSVFFYDDGVRQHYLQLLAIKSSLRIGQKLLDLIRERRMQRELRIVGLLGPFRFIPAQMALTTLHAHYLSRTGYAEPALSWLMSF
jgi:hypothetical protein